MVYGRFWYLMLTRAQFTYVNNTLRASVSGVYEDGLPLANITIAGITSRPRGVDVQLGGQRCNTGGAKLMYGDGDVLFITALEEATKAGAWSGNLGVQLKGQGGGW